MKYSARAGFTLMEVLLAISLIAAAAGFAGMYVGLFSESNLKTRPPQSVFMSALKLAQIECAARGTNVSLSYSKEGYFALCDAADKSVITKVWLTPELAEAANNTEPDYGIEIPTNEVSVSFIPVYPEVIGTSSVNFPEGNLPELILAPDGSMTPAKVMFEVGGDEPAVFELDPFCAGILEEKHGR